MSELCVECIGEPLYEYGMILLGLQRFGRLQCIDLRVYTLVKLDQC